MSHRHGIRPLNWRIKVTRASPGAAFGRPFVHSQSSAVVVGAWSAALHAFLEYDRDEHETEGELRALLFRTSCASFTSCRTHRLRVTLRRATGRQLGIVLRRTERPVPALLAVVLGRSVVVLGPRITRHLRCR